MSSQTIVVPHILHILIKNNLFNLYITRFFQNDNNINLNISYNLFN